jgi:hypothetical protein
MSTLSWFLIGYLIWLVLGVIRFLQLMGHKNRKDTFLDKVLITGAMPIAYLMGAITYIIEKFKKNG